MARLQLRPYQTEALEAVPRSAARGVRRQLIVLPVGSGKTVVAARVPEIFDNPRMTYTAHRWELLDQTRKVFRRERPDRPVGVERAGEHPSPHDLTVVASIQSLWRPDRLACYRPEDWPVMVVDEAHRSPAETYLAVFRHFAHLPADGRGARDDGLLLGITGTAKRSDEVGLGYVFQEVVYTRTLRDMVEEGYLVPLRGYLRRAGADLDGVRTRIEDGERDFDPHALAKAINTPERNRLVVDGTRHKALAEGRPTIVFTADIQHGEDLAAMFRASGVRAANIHGNLRPDVRQEMLEQFKTGQLDVLLSCQLLLEGIDIPQISAIVWGRPTKSSLLYGQGLGRGTRLYPGKTDCIVLDFVDNSQKHATALVSLPTLFGLPPGFDLKGAAAHVVIKQFEDVAVTLQSGLDVEAVEKIRSPQDIPRVFYEVDLLKIAGVSPRVSRLTAFAWQRMPDGTLTLTIPRARAVAHENGELAPQSDSADAGTSLALAENVLGHWEVRHQLAGGHGNKLAEYATLEDALAAADRRIREQYRDRMVLLSKWARWRKEPATERQLRYLEALGQPIPRDKAGTVVLTKGQAQLLIDRALALKQPKSSVPATIAAGAGAPAVPEPATAKQLRYLGILGVAIPRHGLSKPEAQRLINKAKAARQPKVPAGARS